MMMVVTGMCMRMSVTHCRKANNVDYQAKHADDKELVQAMKLVAFPNAFERIQNDLKAHETGSYVSSWYDKADNLLTSKICRWRSLTKCQPCHNRTGIERSVTICS